MKKHHFYMSKWIVIWGIFVSLSVGLCACGQRIGIGDGSDGSSRGKDHQAVAETGPEKRIPWRITHTELPDVYELATVKEDKVYGCFYTLEGLAVVVSETGSGAQVNRFSIPDVTQIQSITVDAQDRICLFGTVGDEYVLWQVSPEGEIRTVGDVELEDQERLERQKGFYADRNGFYYLWYDLTVPCTEVYEDGEEDVYTILDRIYVMDPEMNMICYEQVPDSLGNLLVSLLFDGEGVPMLFAKDQEGYYTRRVRTERRDPYEPCRLEGLDENTMYQLRSGENLALTEEGLLYSRDGALYLCHLNSGTESISGGTGEAKLLELAMGGIFPEDIIYLEMRGETIEIIDNYQGSGRSEYTRFEVGESEEQVQLTFGCLTLSPEMRNTIVAFNRSQDRVRIEPVIYLEGYDYDGGYERLKLDVIRGKAPDLIDTYGVDAEILAKKGAFRDLYGFLDGDPECSLETLLPGVMKAYEVEGKLYAVSPAFRLYTMWGGKSLVQGRSGVDMEELMRILQENGGDINSIYGFSADESVLRTLCSLAMGEFIDWEKGTCDFTCEEFRQILEFAGQYQGPRYGESLYGAIRGKQILLSLGPVSSVEDYRLQSELYGEKVEFIGYPTAGGTGSTVYFTCNEVAISAGSERPEEAWEFIKYYLLHGYNGQGFPTVREQFEQVLQKSMEEELVKGEDGRLETVYRINYSEYQNDVHIAVSKADQEDVDTIRRLVESTTRKFQYYNAVQTIIDEESESYFSGQKTLDEVTKIIQNRVSLYLTENLS